MEINEITPFIIMLLSSLVLYGLHKLYQIKKDWQLEALMFIPAAYFLVYLWIAIFEPCITTARDIARLTLIFSLGNSIPVIFTYLSELKRGRGIKNK